MSDMLLWMFQNAVVVVLLVAIVLPMCRLIRNRPALQHALWLVVLVKFITPPLIVWPWSLVEIRIRATQLVATDDAVAATTTTAGLSQPKSSNNSQTEALVIVPSNELGTLANGESEGSVPIHESQLVNSTPLVAGESHAQELESSRLWRSAVSLLGSLWLMGCVWKAGVQSLRTVRQHAIVLQGKPAPSKVTREVAGVAKLLKIEPVRTLVVEKTRSPFLWCIGRVFLVWPKGMTGSAQLIRSRSIIAHELAHVRRLDHWFAWLDMVVGIIWWWNPLYWFVRGRLRETSEMACDAIALSIYDDREAYAKKFLALSSSLNNVPVPFLGVNTGTPSSFERRLTMILDDRVSGKLTNAGLLLCGCLTAIALPGWSLAQVKSEVPPPIAQDGTDALDQKPYSLPSVDSNRQAQQSLQEEVSSHLPENTNLNWVFDIDEANSIAKECGKGLCVLFTGKGWCQPCEVLDQQLLHDPNVVTYITERFIPVELDFTFRPEQSPTEKLRESRFQNWAKEFAVHVYPTFVFMDNDRRPYFVATGWDPDLTAEQFLAKMENALEQKAMRDRFFSLAKNLSGEKQSLALHQGIEAVSRQLGTFNERKDDPVLFYYADEVLSILATGGTSDSLLAAKQVYHDRFAERASQMARRKVFDQLKELQKYRRFDEGIVLLRELLNDPELAPDRRKALNGQLENFLGMAGQLPELLAHYDEMLEGGLDPKSRLIYQQRKAKLLFYNMKQMEEGMSFVDRWITTSEEGSKSQRRAFYLKGMVLWQNEPESPKAIDTWRKLRSICEPETFDYLTACAYLARCESAAGNPKSAAASYHEVLNTLISQKESGQNAIPWPWNSKAIPGSYLQTAEYYMEANDARSALELLELLDLDSVQIENGGQNNPHEIQRLREWKERLLSELKVAP